MIKPPNFYMIGSEKFHRMQKIFRDLVTCWQLLELTKKSALTTYVKMLWRMWREFPRNSIAFLNIYLNKLELDFKVWQELCVFRYIHKICEEERVGVLSSCEAASRKHFNFLMDDPWTAGEATNLKWAFCFVQSSSGVSMCYWFIFSVYVFY